MVGKTCEKIFFGWEQPLLPRVASWIVERYQNESQVWCRDLVCVLPGSRASRRFLELLSLEAAKVGKAVVPPQISLIGSLPEVLSGFSSSYASSEELQLVWKEVLKDFPHLYERLSPKAVGQEANVAVQLEDLWSVLGREGLTFSSVEKRLRENFDSVVSERWGVLVDLEKRFLELLDQYGVHERNAQRQNILSVGLEKTQKEYLLIGALDLSKIGEQFLDQSRDKIIACIQAPAEMEEGFSNYGAFDKEFWHKRFIDGEEELLPLVVSEDLPSQVAAVIEFIEKAAGDFAAQEMTIGLVDEANGPYLNQVLSAVDVSYHSSLQSSSLLSSVSSFWKGVERVLLTGGYFDLLELIRNPLTLRLFDLQDLSLEQLQRFGDDVCPHTVFPFDREAFPKVDSRIKEALSVLSHQLEIFLEKRIIGEWSEKLASRFLGRDDEVKRVMGAVFSEWHSRHGEISDHLQEHFSGIEVCGALAQIALQIEDPTEGREQDTPGIEIVGWLELYLDDSPVTLVTGMHEAVLPGYRNEHPWLPQRVRAFLNIEDEKHRLGRDNCLLTTLHRSRKEFACFYARQSMEGEYLRPSRLLYRGGDQALLPTVESCFLESSKNTRIKIFGDAFGESSPWSFLEEFYQSAKRDIPVVGSLSVTGFRDYLRCPFRFFLKHVLKLQTSERLPQELDALRYGNLVHLVLEDFAGSTLCSSSDPEEIEAYLLKQLSVRCRALFGKLARPAVEVQIHLLRGRLSAFAKAQAEWRSTGWEIAHSEYSFVNDQVSLAHPLGSTFLRGRIDRIDYHKGEDRWIALDYKTGTYGYAPEDVHYNGREEEWRDLQLPLYREALQQLGFRGDIATGYVNLPAGTDGTGFFLTEWSEEQYRQAGEIAQEVARSIYAGEFWPPSDEVFAFDDFADLLGHGQYGDLVVGEEGV